MKARIIQTSPLYLKQGQIRLQFFKYPETESFLKPLPVDAEREFYYKQKLYISAKSALRNAVPFKRGVWLSPDKAFNLYFFIQELFLGIDGVKPFVVMDDESVVRFYPKDEEGSGVFTLVAESRKKEQKQASKIAFDYEEALAFMSFLKSFAIMSLFIAGQEEYVILQRWGSNFLFLHPVVASISDTKLEKARELIKAFKANPLESQNPVLFKNLYALKHRLDEEKGELYLNTPTGNIKLDERLMDKLLVFLTS